MVVSGHPTPIRQILWPNNDERLWVIYNRSWCAFPAMLTSLGCCISSMQLAQFVSVRTVWVIYCCHLRPLVETTNIIIYPYTRLGLVIERTIESTQEIIINTRQNQKTYLCLNFNNWIQVKTNEGAIFVQWPRFAVMLKVHRLSFSTSCDVQDSGYLYTDWCDSRLWNKRLLERLKDFAGKKRRKKEPE